jgi:hypothetical protein
MFRDLDDTLKKMLDDPAMDPPLAALLNADVSFVTPDKNFAPAQPTVNLFLYEVCENRELRDPVPITETVAGVVVRRTPPLRVDCKYLVTAWSNLLDAAKVAQEHRLLAQALQWLSRFPTIPTTSPPGYAVGALIGQPFPPPTLVAQLSAEQNTGEFWSALGTPPRPAFYVTATVAVDLRLQVAEGPPVVSSELRLRRKMPEGIPEPVLDNVFVIGGTVRNNATLAVIPGAQVTLVERGWVETTDQDGRFRLSPLDTGSYTLRAAAPGFITQTKAVTVPGTVLNEYDFTLIP